MKHLDLKAVICFLIIFSFLPPSQLKATEFVTTNAYNFESGLTLDDDLIMTGGYAKINGNINGDFIGACRSVVINGDINGSILCADQYTKVFGNINGSMRTFCQDSQLNGTVKRNVMAFCSSYTLGPEGRIGKDLLAFAGEVVVEGRVGNNVLIKGGDIVISGTIDGNADIEADKITLLPTAVIKGNLNYTSKRQAKIEDGATVLGSTKWSEDTSKKSSKRRWVGSLTIISAIILMISIAVQIFALIIAVISGKTLLTVILFGGALYIAMVLMIAILKKSSKSALEISLTSPLKSFSLGLVAFIVLPIITIFFTLTLIGIPIGLILVFILGILSVLGWIVGALAFGHFLIKILKISSNPSPYLSGLIGIVMLLIFAGIPILGPIAAFVITFLGMGAIILSKYRAD